MFASQPQLKKIKTVCVCFWDTGCSFLTKGVLYMVLSFEQEQSMELLKQHHKEDLIDRQLMADIKRMELQHKYNMIELGLAIVKEDEHE